MSEIAQELTKEFESRNDAIFKAKSEMSFTYNEAITVLEHLLEGSEWFLEYSNCKNLKFEEDYSVRAILVLKNRKYDRISYPLDIKIKHVTGPEFLISTINENCDVYFYAKSGNNADNTQNLSNLLRCFIKQFPEELPADLQELISHK